MAKSDIEEQIDIFMAKLEKSKVPKKASGEAIVSGKPEKVKPPKKGSIYPTFGDIGITGFTPIDKNDAYYGELLKITELVAKVKIPVYASEMSPSLQIMALVFSNTTWAAKMKAFDNNANDMPLSQACIELGLKLDEWGQSKDWQKIKKHLPEAFIEADEGPVLESKNMSDGAIVTYLQELPANMAYPEKEKAILKKFPLLHPSPDLTILINTHCKDTEIIEKAIKDGEEWLPKQAEPAETPEGYSKFLKELVEVVTVLEATESTDGTLIPDHPIVLMKYKEKWTTTVMTKEEKAEPKQLPPGPEVGVKPGVFVLTHPVKIRSPGDNKVAVPPTFISLPPGVVTVTKFIWTIPIEVASDMKCQVVVGYGAETFIMKGNFKSASEALPFKMNKGGVLKVSLQTIMPMEAWLELELHIESPGFVVKLGEMFSSPPQPVPLLAAPAPKEKLKEPVTDDQKIKAAILEVTDAQKTLLGNIEKLETMAQELLGKEIPESMKEAIEEQKQKMAVQQQKMAVQQEAVLKQDQAGLDEVANKKVKQTPTSPLGSIDLKTGETASVPAGHPSLAEKGYKPGLIFITIDKKKVTAKQMADALRDHLKVAGFAFYTIESDTTGHEYKKTKGVLMHFKITWAGDPEANLIKWAVVASAQGIKKAKDILVHYADGAIVPLTHCLEMLVKGIKQGGKV